jgi:squalene-associated FAD-dependent desaturase
VAGRVIIVGAGLAGLAAAVDLAERRISVSVYEAAGQAGGRCRSFFEPALDRTIDNGNHLVLSGNRAVADYLALIGASARLVGPDRAEYPFFDLATGERWCLRPGASRVPWWIFSSHRRVPGTRARDYLNGLRLAFAGDDSTVAQTVGNGVLYRRFWEPLTIAVLNASGEEGAASLLWPVVRETFGRGESACRPRIAARGLSDCFVEPALALLATRGIPLHFRHRLRALRFDAGWVNALEFASNETLAVEREDAVILAVPQAVAADLLPDLPPPSGHRAIINAHFRLPRRCDAVLVLGLLGGLGHWLFVRDDIASVTISAADSLLSLGSDELAERTWREVALALDLGGMRLPAYRVIREKRATILQTPEAVLRRPPSQTRWSNLFLAGDWTATGLPATIEASVRSGNRAAAKARACVAAP